MKLMRAGMEEENHKMRRIISVYIQSSDLNDPAWDVMDEDDMGGECPSVFVLFYLTKLGFVGDLLHSAESCNEVIV